MAENRYKVKTQPKFQKLDTIDPGIHCYNVYVKVESTSAPLFVKTKNNEDLKIVEALVYDETSKINIKIVGKYADLLQPGKVIALRNGKSVVFKEKQRLEIDIWGKITEEVLIIESLNFLKQDHKIELSPEQIAALKNKSEILYEMQIIKVTNQ